MSKQQKIYLDYAATTPLDTTVFDAMQPWLTERFGNSSSLHSFGRDAAAAVEEAREIFAGTLNCAPSEIVFTSSATEANNMVLKGMSLANQGKKKHMIISAIEHSSVYQTAAYLRQNGWDITLLPVDEGCIVDLHALQDSIGTDTLLVSVMLVNNETGVIQPLKEIAGICKQHGVLLHSDAAQGLGKLPIDVQNTGIDLLTASSHKIYGPLGAGLLYIKKGINIAPLLHGGGHESGRRASTVNISAVVGFAQAMERYSALREEENERIIRFKQEMVRFISDEIPQTRINGDREQSVPQIVNISFKNVDAELLAMVLDQKGVAVSTGSACAAGTVKTSRVLQACHVPSQWLRGAIRISMGRFTTKNEIDFFLRTLKEAVKQVRNIS